MSDTTQLPAATPVPEPQTPVVSATPVPTPAPTPKPVVTEPPAPPKPANTPPATPRPPAATKPPQVASAVVSAAPEQHPEPTTPVAAVLPPQNVVKPPAAVSVADVVRPVATNTQIVSVVTEHLTNYKTYLSGRNATPTTFKSAIVTFSTVVKIALRTPTADVLDVIWDFFVANKTGVLQESSALQGITVLDKPTRMKVEVFYILFRQAVNGIDVGDSANIRLEIAQAKLQCPQLLVFLQQKAATVVNAAGSVKK